MARKSFRRGGRARLGALAGVLAALCVFRTGVADQRVAPLDLLRHDPADKADIRKVAEGVYEWHLPTGDAQTLRIDLSSQGIDPRRYDELRFDIQPLGSQVGLSTAIAGLPTDKDVSRWYLKFRAPAGRWSSGRYDLRVDDDGFTGRPTAATALRVHDACLGAVAAIQQRSEFPNKLGNEGLVHGLGGVVVRDHTVHLGGDHRIARLEFIMGEPQEDGQHTRRPADLH